MLAGVRARTSSVGHVHLQYRRPVGDVEVVNPGSVGLPFDGDRRAAWALLDEGGSSCGARPTTSTRVIAAVEASDNPAREVVARRLRRPRLARRSLRLLGLRLLGRSSASRPSRLASTSRRRASKPYVPRLVVARVLEPVGQVALAAGDAALVVRVAVADAAAQLLGAADSRRRAAAPAACAVPSRRTSASAASMAT